MRALIKSSDAAAGTMVRPLAEAVPAAAPVPPPAPAPDPELAELRSGLDLSTRRLAERDADVARLEAALAGAVAQGEAAGRRAAAEEARALHAETLARLEAGIAAGLDRFGATLASLDRLAVLVARECLERMIGDPGTRLDLLARMIRRQIGHVEGGSLVRIEVSRQDFEDPADLAALAGGLASPALALSASDDIASGGCTIVLQLGTLEVGLDQQWGRIDAVLREMAEAEVPA